jgi:MarR family transcriptional regulator, organic hydroperoxide resistance regulator
VRAKPGKQSERGSHTGARKSLTHEDEALRVLMKFRQIIGSAKRHFELVRSESGISGAQLWALWQVNVEPGLRVSHLARLLSIHQSTASNLLDQLQEKGLVYRERAGRDQRVVRVFATQAGLDVLKAAPGPTRGILSDAVSQLSDTTLRQLNEALELLVKNLSLKDEKSAKQPLSDLLV